MLAADRATLLERRSAAFRQGNITRWRCSVCGRGTLDETWAAAAARAALEQNGDAARALNAASRRDTASARKAVLDLVRGSETSASRPDLPSLTIARKPMTRSSNCHDDDTALADHAGNRLPLLRECYPAAGGRKRWPSSRLERMLGAGGDPAGRLDGRPVPPYSPSTIGRGSQALNWLRATLDSCEMSRYAAGQ